MAGEAAWEELAKPTTGGYGEFCHLAYHPGEQRLWRADISSKGLPGSSALTLELGPFDDTSFHVEIKGELPAYDTRYLTGTLFYFDTRTERLRYALKEGFGGKPPWVFEVHDGKLGLVETTAASKTIASDRLSYDPKRSVLVHLKHMGHRNPGKVSQKGVLVYELHGDAWREVGGLFTGLGVDSVDVWCGWDAARGLTVAVDHLGVTYGWDGSRWHELPELSDGFWRKPRFATTEEGYLVTTFEERGQQIRYLLRVLGKDGWLAPKSDNLLERGPGVFHPRARHARFLSVNFEGDGSCQWGEVEVDGDEVRWKLVEPYVPTGHAVALDGDELLYLGRDPMYRFRDGRFEPCRGVGEPLLAALSGPDVLAVAESGNVYRRKGDEWVKQPSKGYSPCDQPALARRSDGSIVLCTGREPGYGKMRKQTWVWSSKGWEQLATKGRAPALADALAIWDEKNERLIVTAGRAKRDTEDATYELRGNVWQQFDGGLSQYEQNQLHYDATTGIVFATSNFGLRVYRGEGRWQDLDRPYPKRDVWMVYDSAKRRLWGGAALFDLGPWLDEVAARVPSEEPPKQKAPKPATAKDSPPVRYLRSSEDGADKFWIAEVRGKVVSVHWGRRGTKGQKKEFKRVSDKQARLEFDRRVAEKLADGYWDAPEKEKAAEIPGRIAGIMDFEKGGVDRVGGRARIASGRWPKCTGCKEPMSHVMTLARDDERLPLKENAGIAVFMCLNEETAGSCETWEAFSGANAVLWLSATELGDKRGTAPPEGAREVIERGIRYRRVFEPDPSSEETEHEIQNKVGGYPVWYQGDATPECPECKKPLRFAAQISEVSEPLNFGGDGVGYVLVCADEHAAAFLWQSG